MYTRFLSENHCQGKRKQQWVSPCWYVVVAVQSLSHVQLIETPHGLQHARLLCPSPSPGAWQTPFSIWNQSVFPCLVWLLLLDLHTGFAGGRSDGLVFLSLKALSTVCCDPHSQRLEHAQWSRCFSGILLLFLWSNGCWQFDLWFLCLF